MRITSTRAQLSSPRECFLRLDRAFAKSGHRIQWRYPHQEDPHMSTATDTAAQERWEKENAAAPTRKQPPTTVSSVPIEALYSPENLADFDPDTELGYPGQYPFTRGVHASMYRSRLWTMRQFAGFGSAAQTME